MLARIFAAMALAGALVSGANTCAQSFPSKPIRIVTYPPGGGTDVAGPPAAQSLALRIPDV